MNKRLLSIFLTLCMVLNLLPISTMAKETDTTIGTSGEIIYFTPLVDTEKTVATGTYIEDLELPETLTATVRTGVIPIEEAVQDSSSQDEGELVDDSTVVTTGSAITEEISQFGETGEVAVFGWEETTVDIPVTWTSSDYNMDTEGEYVFKPVIEGYTVSAELPQIKVIVGTVRKMPLTISPQAVGGRFLAPITIGSNTNVSWEFVILTEPDGETNGTVQIYSPKSGLEQQYTGDLIIPETVTNNGKTYDVTKMSSHAFNSCKMTRVFIPKTIGGSIGADVFSGAPNLVAFIVDPENTAFCSEEGVLYDKNKTTLIRYPVTKTDTTFTIPSSVSTLNSCAFNGCKNITYIDIPETVITMGESHLFYGCSALTEVTIPSGVSDIPHATFIGCTALRLITFNRMTAPALNQYAFASDPKNFPIDLKFKIPAGSTGYTGEGASDEWKSLADKFEPVPVTNYSVWVGGIQVTSANASDVLGDAKVSYNASTNTLTLTDANITTAHEFDFNPFSKGLSGIYVKGDLNLVLAGSNSIGGSSFDTTGAVSAGIFVSQGNLNISGTGSLTATAGKAGNSSTGVNIENFDKSLTICDGANVTAIGGNGYYSRGVFVNGSLMIDGGSLAAMGDDSGDSSSSYGAYGGYLNSSFTIKNGGSLTAVGGNAKYTSGGAYFSNISNNIIVESGNLTASANDAANTSIGIKGDTISIGDGTVTASAKKQAMKVALTFGSSYVHKNTAAFIADGSGATVLNDSELASGIEGYKYVKIEPAPKVARIGSISYVTLQEAFDAVADGQAIQLQDNTILDKTVTIASGNTNSFALDLNGKILDGGHSVCITHEGSGTLTVTDSSDEGNGTVTTNSTQPVLVNYANDGLSISGGTVINTGNGPAISTEFDKKITISNTARIISGNENKYFNKSTIWLKGGTASNTILEITGGTIENTAADGNAIYNSGLGGTVSIPSGSPVILGGYAAMNVAPDLNSYTKAHVTASANFDGSSPVNEYVAHNISLYKYLTFEQSFDTTVTNLNLADKLTAPVMGATPEESITDDQYTGKVTWNDTPTKFLGSTAYTATVTLTAKDGYTFSGVEKNALTYFEATSVTNIVGYGKTLTVTILFPQTEAKVLQSIIITTPPVKTTYQHGEAFNPAGMVVKAIYNDGTENASFTDYTVNKTGVLTVSDTKIILTANSTSITTTQVITVTKETPTITDLNYDLTSVNYDGSAKPLSIVQESGKTLGAITVKYNGSTTEPNNAGTYAITVDIAGNAEYNAVAGLSLGDYTINKIAYTGITTVVTNVLISGQAGATVTLPTLPIGATYDTPVASGAIAMTGMSIVGTTLTYTAPVSTAGQTGTITIPVTGATNYNDYSIVVTVTANHSENGYDKGESSSDNSSPVIVTPPVPDKPNSPTQGEIKIPGKVDKRGNTTVYITDKTVIDAFDKAVEDAKKDGNEQNGITVVLRVDTGNKITSNVTVNLPKTVQDIIIKKKIVNILVVVDNPDVRISMDLATIKEINKQAKSDVSITATRIDSGKLTGNAKKAIGSRPVFDFKVNYGKGKQVKSFGTGRVWISIPYTLDANEKAGNVQAVYVDDKGKVHWLINSVYDSVEKVLRFSTNNFSTYGIGYKQTNTAHTDIADHWTKEDIEFVVSRGLINGISETTFNPNAAMTRGMFVTALGRMANANVSGYKKSSFTDVNKDAYYMCYIEWAYKNNIVTDTGNGTFSPDQSINREQMAVIMQNYANAIGFTLPKVYMENTFADSEKISDYAKDAVKQMQMAGILYSKNGNRFDPLSTATRAEVSVVLRRFLELTISCDTIMGWAQNDAGEWLYYKNGKAITGTQTIDGKQYYFNASGILKTGIKVSK